jgi:heat-inducible transcriptional repressor
VDARRYLLHVAIDSGFVRTMTVEVETEIGSWRLERACGMMNERFFGMSLRQMGEEGEKALSDIEPLELGVIQLFVPSIRKMLQGEADVIHTEGETNIMLKPEFSGREKLGAVVEILGEKKMLMHMFDTQGAQAGKVMVSIGGENRSGMFQSFSVLKTNYQIGNLQGSLGIMGPKRMPYPFLVSAVAYTAKALEQLHR